MSSKKRNIYIYLGKVILITLLIVLCIRTFFIESYSISSAQMETTLLEGDKILIDKTAYGIRMPITILSIPFTFDNLFGIRSYSTAIELPYKRILADRVERNDIVLFNNPSDIDKPLDKRSLILSRCVALPGDTIQVRNGLFYINNKQYISSPDVVYDYMIRTSKKADLIEKIEDLGLSVESLEQLNDTIYLQLNKLDAFILDKSLPDSVNVVQKIDSTQNYSIPMPSKGKTIEINPQSLVLYKQIILLEQGDRAKITEDKLHIAGKEQDVYTFMDDYYWMLSDNTSDSQDSRFLGFIPFKNIIGKARFIWYSSDNKVRWDRCFSSIN